VREMMVGGFSLARGDCDCVAPPGLRGYFDWLPGFLRTRLPLSGRPVGPEELRGGSRAEGMHRVVGPRHGRGAPVTLRRASPAVNLGSPYGPGYHSVAARWAWNWKGVGFFSVLGAPGCDRSLALGHGGCEREMERGRMGDQVGRGRVALRWR
jgi:hypothetical protein